MGTRTKNQIVLKKQKCGGFLFKIFEHESLIRSTIVALAGNSQIDEIKVLQINYETFIHRSFYA